jgi:hypothetical protein
MLVGFLGKDKILEKIEMFGQANIAYAGSLFRKDKKY